MRKSFLSICFLLVGYLSFSQDNSKAYDALIKKGNSLYEVKDYINSAVAFSSAFLLPGQSISFDDRYACACSWSLASKNDSAFTQLYLIADLKNLNYNDVDDILTDKDLKPLLKDTRWQDVKNKMFIKAYKTFLTTQQEAGLKVDMLNAGKIALKWARGNSIDSALVHLNEPAYDLLKNKKFPQAYRYLKVSLNNFPGNYIFNRDMGYYYAVTKDNTRAFVYYSRALDLKYYTAMADTMRLAIIDSALVADYQQLSKQTNRTALPTDNMLFSLAGQLMRRGMTGKAYEVNKLNIKYHPKSFKAMRGMSDYYNAAGDKENGDSYNTRSLLLQYRLPENFFQTEFNVEEYLVTRYEEVSRQRGFKVLMPEGMLNTLANYFLNKKMYSKAELLYKMNLVNYPQSPNAYNRMSAYYKATGDTIKEQEFTKKARDIKNKPLVQRFSGNTAVADTTFNTIVEKPVCKEVCAKILIDEAHNNYHTAEGRYKPFANLVANDGFIVTSGRTPFTRELLKTIHVLVVASTGAIPGAEIKILTDWIRQGGSLLVITDHDNPGSNDLFESVGVQTPDINYTLDTLHGTSAIFFSEKEGLLGDHPIINGRDASEKIRRVNSFTGRSIIAPAGGSVLLPLATSAVDYMTIDPTLRSIEDMIPIEVRGLRCHGVAFSFGKGRVVAFSEAAMLTAQFFPPDGQAVGMNVSGSDNRQFVLNVMRWLTGYLK
ncbi:MAG: DUF4350 domain-containing protein [Ferruginibacter sp.]